MMSFREQTAAEAARAAKLSQTQSRHELRHVAPLVMSPPRTSGWDPVLLISQIVSVQTVHYLALSILVPPLLSLFAEPNSLNYEGGAASVGMVMDWREMAGRPTVRGWNREDRWDVYSGAWSGGRKFDHEGFDDQQWSGIDPIRGWIIAFCWLMASCADVYSLYLLVRRPRLILDFALTLIFNHLVLTTYYSSSVPTSLFFWAVLLASCTGIVIVTEQLCVKREMNDGLAVPAENALDEIEIGGLRRD